MSSTASSSTPKRANAASGDRGATALRTHRAGALDPRRASAARCGWAAGSTGGGISADWSSSTCATAPGWCSSPAIRTWTPPEVMERAAGLGAETVVLVAAPWQLRPEPSRDPALASREVEVHVTGTRGRRPGADARRFRWRGRRRRSSPAEELRLRHRVLDLRRPELQREPHPAPPADAARTRRYLDASSASSRSRRRSSPSRRPKARATTWCRAGCTRASSTRCRSRRRSTSSC